MARSVHARLAMFTLVATVVLSSGCICYGSPDVWIEKQQRLELSASDIDTLQAITHNGHVNIKAATGDTNKISVDISIKAGGDSQEDAQACFNAFEIVTPVTGQTQVIKTNWKNH